MLTGKPYVAPVDEKNHAGIVVSLSRYQYPDDEGLEGKEIAWRLRKEWHVGLIVRDKDSKKITERLEHYTEVIQDKYHASAPAPEKSP
jgi:hypothetical protein